MAFQWDHGYTFDEGYKKKVAYFCMEYGIEQALKTYAGGLGFLAGSHCRSAFDLKQAIVGVGILWKNGYYSQVRKPDQCMDVLFEEKKYAFLQETNLRFSITISKHEVWVTAYYLSPDVFGTIPIFLLTTDLHENDYLAKTISQKLYDPNPETSIAASILLGVGGAKLLELIGWEPDVYHLNESHALPLAYALYRRHQRKKTNVSSRLVFTNHTPEDAGNRFYEVSLLKKMSFFLDLDQQEIENLSVIKDGKLDLSLTAFQWACKSNAVSVLHRNTMVKKWGIDSADERLISITNAQHAGYWKDHEAYRHATQNNLDELLLHKRNMKKRLLEYVSDQCGKIFKDDICTLVFAKRFAGYKRPDIFFHDMEHFIRFISNKDQPVQLIWAGKPYPMDYNGIGMFDKIVDLCKAHANCAILVGYELAMARWLKAGADIWLNMPRLYHEASGTSGMTAAMNGAVNVAIPDGWYAEFAQDEKNGFVVPPSDPSLSDDLQDDLDSASLYQVLEKKAIPMYYHQPINWAKIMQQAMQDILPSFDSNRLAKAYYEELYA
jgi:starch phosphorylase